MKSLFKAVPIVLIALLLMFVMPASAQTMAQTQSCGLNAIVATTTAASTQIIAAPTGQGIVFINGTGTAVGNQRIKICSITVKVKQAAGAAAYGLTTGTGTNCGTGNANLTPQWDGTASVEDTWDHTYGADGALIAPVGKAVCLKLSATPTNAQVIVVYSIGR